VSWVKAEFNHKSCAGHFDVVGKQ